MDELNFLYVYYFNDEKKDVTVQINHTFFFDPNNPHKQPNIENLTMRAGEFKVLKVEAPNNSIPYVKKWNNHVLVSYIDLDQALDLTQITGDK